MPRRVVRLGAWVLLFAALGAAAAAWFTPTPELDADDAERLALDALAGADVEGDVTSPPRKADHRTRDDERVGVWIVEVETVADDVGEVVELRVQRSAGRLVYVDDRIGHDDAERLLTDEQFEALGERREDSPADRWVVRNALAALSALLVAGTCFVLATRAGRIEETR